MSRSRRMRLEAVVQLVVAHLTLAALPYRKLTRVFERPARSPEFHGPERERTCMEVRAAVQHAAGRLPGSRCLPRAMAAQAMLRRRAITTTLYLGVGREPGESFGSHAWLKDGDLGVAGSRASGPYTPVASYSGARR